jgi:hypothetical protein
VHWYIAAGPHAGLLGSSVLRLTSPVIWEPLDYLTVLLEAGFIVAIVSPRSVRVLCAVAIVFHLATFVALGIDFTPNVVAYAVFVRWSRAVDCLHISPRTRGSAADARAWLVRKRAAAGPLVVLSGAGLYALTSRVGAPAVYAVGHLVGSPQRTATLLLFGLALLVPLAKVGSQGATAIRLISRRTPTGA